MKKNWCLSILFLFALCFAGESVSAQGILVIKKDGTQIKIPYEEFDFMKVYEPEIKVEPETVTGNYYGDLKMEAGGTSLVETGQTVRLNLQSRYWTTNYQYSLYIPGTISGGNGMTMPSIFLTDLEVAATNDHLVGIQVADFNFEDDGKNVNVQDLTGEIDLEQSTFNLSYKIQIGKMPMVLKCTFNGVLNGEPNPTPQGGENQLPAYSGKRLIEYDEVEAAQFAGEEGVSYYTYNYKFEYDATGHVSKIVTVNKEEDLYTDTVVQNYEWKGNQIMASSTSGEGKNSTYMLEGQRLVVDLEQAANYDIRNTYKYSDAGQLVEFYSDFYYDGSVRVFNWDNEHLVEINNYSLEYVSESGKLKIEYLDQPCNGYFPFVYEMLSSYDSFVFAHPELLGDVIHQLPLKITFNGIGGDEEVYDFSYEFDSDGYPVKCIMKCLYTYMEEDGPATSSSTFTMTLTWK